MMQLTWCGKVLQVAGLLLLGAVMAACGGGGTTSDKGVAKTAISGSVTFPALGSIVAKPIGAAKVVAAETTTASLEIRDLSGALVKTVPLTLQSGTVDTYTYAAIELPTGKDYVLKAVKESMVLRALVDKAALSGTTTTKNVNNITTTALIVVEKALSLVTGTLGQTASTVQAQAASESLALMSTPATIESNITAAIAACTSTSGTATSSQAQLASLANIVTAAVGSNVDASTFMSGASNVATINAVTYTVSGTTATGSTAAVTTGTAGTFATDIVATLPKISSAGSTSFTVGTDGTFAITGTGTFSASGTLPSGVEFSSGTGVLSGTPAAGSNGAYTLTITATSGSGLTATQAFTLTVNPAVVVTPPVGFTTEMISGKTFAEGSTRIKFLTNGTVTASDTQDALTWAINSSGKVVVNNATNSSTTTITLVSGNLTSGLQISMVHTDDNTTETATLTVVTSGPQSLVGSWYVPFDSAGAGPAKGPIVFTFIDGTKFIMAHDGDIVADPSGQPGIERGTYTWNPATGAFTAQVVTDSNGDWGLSNTDVGELLTLTVSLDGNSLLLNGIAFATKVKESSSSPIIGSWFTPDAGGGIAITFLDGTNYMMAHDGVQDFGGQRGIERGTYTWNPVTGAISVVVSVDTNGEWGLSNASEKFLVSSDGNSLLMDGVAFGWNVNDNSRSFTSGSVTAQW